jgi:general secretion pathway protein D
MTRLPAIVLLLTIGVCSTGPLPFSHAAEGDEPAEKKTLIYIVKHLPATELSEVVSQYLEANDQDGSSVIAEPVGNHLLVTVAPAALERVTKLLAELDRPSKMVSIEVRIAEARWEADAPGETQPSATGQESLETGEQVLARIRELEKSGRLEVLNHVKLTTLENQPAVVQVGERAPVVTGVSYTRPPSRTSGSPYSGPRTQNVSFQEVGLMVNVVPRVTSDGLVVVELDITKSRLTRPEPQRPSGEGEDTAPLGIPRTVTTTAKTTVSIADGQTVVIDAVSERSTSEQSELLIIATARILAR